MGAGNRLAQELGWRGWLVQSSVANGWALSSYLRGI